MLVRLVWWEASCTRWLRGRAGERRRERDPTLRFASKLTFFVSFQWIFNFHVFSGFHSEDLHVVDSWCDLWGLGLVNQISLVLETSRQQVSTNWSWSLRLKDSFSGVLVSGQGQRSRQPLSFPPLPTRYCRLEKVKTWAHDSMQVAPGDDGGMQRGTLTSRAEARVVLGCADPNRIILWTQSTSQTQINILQLLFKPK